MHYNVITSLIYVYMSATLIIYILAVYNLSVYGVLSVGIIHANISAALQCF